MNKTLPPLPEWSKMDNLGGLVPSEIRQGLRNYALSAIEAQGVPDGFEQEVWLQKLNDLIDEFGSERVTEAYHGGFHCRRSPSVVRAEISAMLASAPPAQHVKQCEWTNCPTRVGDKCCNEQASVVQQEPIYQYQLADGAWVDQIEDSYKFNKANGAKNIRIVYTHPAPQAAVVQQEPVVPRKLPIPPAPADMADVIYAEGWNQCCDAFFGGLGPQEPVVITVFDSTAPQAKQPLASIKEQTNG